MARRSISVAELAKESGVDLDEVLITLWDARLDYITGPNDVVLRRDTNRARRALGISTRRELSDPNYWANVLGCSVPQFSELLATLDVKDPFDEGHLRKRAIHRLMALGRERGVWPLQRKTPDKSPSTPRPMPENRWTIIGHEREIRYLTFDEVSRIHDALVADFNNSADPISPPGVKSRVLLDSSLGRPKTSMGATLKYPTVEMAAAALMHAMVHNHPFHNGNKRTALVSTIVFLDMNGMMLTCDEDSLFKLVLQLAQHALVDASAADLADEEVMSVAKWFKERSRWIELGDRPIPWRRLRGVLRAYGCEFDRSSGVGNRINIRRTVKETYGFFGRSRNVQLETQTYYGDEGRDVERNTISKIRRDLRLDDDNGVDSAAFYEQSETAPGEFIVRYRKILRRLAKV